MKKISLAFRFPRFFRSFKLRLFVCILIIGILPLFFLRAAIVSTYRTRALSIRLSDVEAQTDILINHLTTNHYIADPSSETINNELDQIANLYDGRIMVIGPNFKILRDTYGVSEGRTVISEEVIRSFKSGQKYSNYDSEYGYIELVAPIKELVLYEDRNETAETVRGLMLISVSTDYENSILGVLNRTAYMWQIIITAIILLLAMIFSRLMTRPFTQIQVAIDHVNEGHMDWPGEVHNYLETEHITESFDGVLERMRALDKGRAEFVSNVSHELKTPLTSMKVLAESLLTVENPPEEMYREFMADIVSEVDRETAIINDLLSLVKMNQAVTMQISEVDMNAMLELIMKRLRPLARKRDIEMTFESMRKVNAKADEVKLSLAFTNLVENAIKYNNEHGQVHVTLDADHQSFYVTVEDTGVGIPEEEQPYIYDRFYRVDKSHSKEISGTGLGLAIAHDSILLHHGSILLESTPGAGSTFTVRVPMNYIP